MLKNKKLLLGLLVGIVSLSFVGYNCAEAAFPGEGLTISPPIVDLKVDEGEILQQTIKVTNPTAELVEVYPQVLDFQASGEGGEPSFYVAETDSDGYSLSRWISFNTSKLALTSEQVVDFTYTITVPTTAEAGGHYGAVFFTTEPEETNSAGSTVSISSMVGSLVLLTVTGETVEKAIVESFDVDNVFNFIDTSIDFTTKIANLGNVHIKPIGDVVIKNAFGNNVTGISFNDAGGNVLPDSTRKFTNTWDFPWYKVGVYRAELALAYGSSGDMLTDSLVFWIIPWWLITSIAVLILAITLLIIWRKKRKGPKVKRIKPENTNRPQAPPQNPNPPVILR